MKSTNELERCLRAIDEFRREVVEIICPLRVTGFRSVGQRYHRFEQTTDKEVKSLLDATMTNGR